MIVKGIVLIILVFGAFFFLGLKISESINSSAIKLFFFSLYFMTIFSIFNLCLTVYFFIKLKDKKGTQGRKGLQGKPGEPGQIGHCGVGDIEKKSNLLKAIHYKLTQNKDKDTKENSCDIMSTLEKYEVSILRSILSMIEKLKYDYDKKLLYFESDITNSNGAPSMMNDVPSFKIVNDDINKIFKDGSFNIKLFKKNNDMIFKNGVSGHADKHGTPEEVIIKNIESNVVKLTTDPEPSVGTIYIHIALAHFNNVKFYIEPKQ